MSILSVCQNAALELGLKEPSAIVGSTNRQARQLGRFAHRTLKDLRLRFFWSELKRLATITLVADQEAYALPADFDHQVYDTHWDRTNQWKLTGPITPQEWRARKEGIVSTSPWRHFSVFGYDLKRLHLLPTPASGDNGDIVVLDYQSIHAFLPVAWTASTVFSAGQYTSYDGNIYSTTAGGSSGATPPTHTTGSASDGGVTWDYSSAAYSAFTKDTDFCVLPEPLVELGIIWRWRRSKGLPYDDMRMDYDNAIDSEKVRQRGAKAYNLTPRPAVKLISGANVPDTGFGQ